jgi:aspartate aminotransferase
VSGVSKFLTCSPERGYFPTRAELDKAWTPKTKALVFSSPGNPSGTMIDPALLKECMTWCQEKKVLLIYDELYERLVLDPKRKHVCALALADEAGCEYILSVNAVSKTMAMTGWRCGWVAGHAENIKRLAAIQSQMMTCIPGFIQDGAVAGLKVADQVLEPIVKAYQRRAKLLSDGLAGIPGVKHIKPEGAFYLFTDVSEVIKRKGWDSDKDFTAKLLEQEKVVVVSGGSFGMPGWVRLSFAVGDEEIKRGIERLKRFCA